MSPSSVSPTLMLSSPSLLPQFLSAVLLPNRFTHPTRRGFSYKGCQHSEVQRIQNRTKESKLRKSKNQKHNKSSNERIGQHQVKDLIDKLKGWPTKIIKKKVKQQRMALNRQPKEYV